MPVHLKKPKNPQAGLLPDPVQGGAATPTAPVRPKPASVADNLTDLLSTDSRFLQQAETQGLKQANKRGLVNSSIAVGAVEDSRIRAALPIASQDAGQAHERGLQSRDIQSRREFLDTDIAGARDRLELELGSRESLQLADQAAEKERLGMTLTHDEQISLRDLQAAQTRLDTELGSRERINAMNLSSNDRNFAASVAQGYEATYSNTIAAIMSNPDIPAAERQRYLNHAATIRDSNLNLLEQFFNIELKWGTSGGGGTPALGPPNSIPGTRIPGGGGAGSVFD